MNRQSVTTVSSSRSRFRGRLLFFAGLCCGFRLCASLSAQPTEDGEREVRGGLQGSGRGEQPLTAQEKAQYLKFLLDAARPDRKPVEASDQKSLEPVAKSLSEDNLEDARGAWTQFLTTRQEKPSSETISAWIAHIVTAGMGAELKPLTDAALSPSAIENAGERIREHLRYLESAAEQGPGKEPQKVKVIELHRTPEGRPEIRDLEEREMKPEEIETVRKMWLEQTETLREESGKAVARLGDVMESSEPLLRRLGKTLTMLREVSNASSK